MKDERKTKKQLINELAKMRQWITELETSQTECKQAEEVLQKRTHDLGERVKELNCLYGISHLVEKPDISLEEILQGIVDLIPPAWQYPEITCARIIVQGQIFRTNNFKETIWKQSCDIIVHGDRVGTLEVCYLEEKPEIYEGPFLKEERSLINAIAERLGKITERKLVEEALRKAHKELERRVEERTAECVRFQKETIYLKKTLDDRVQFHNIIGSSTIMQEVYRRIERVAKTSATILITGESGTGKELVARAIHAHSLRSDKNFIAVNCSAIPESLIESELFGHLKGSFTGAIRDKKGLVEEAHGGTLFLDEIGDLNLIMQTKLLRLLQEGEFKAVGDTKTKKADVRFVAATNQDLAEKVKRKEFRDDLYYRVNVIHVTLPLLRDRKDDIPVLAHYFLRKYSKVNNKKIRGFSEKAMEMLINRDWPGNVRELENVIERGVILSSRDTLDVEDLLPDISVADSQIGYATDIFSRPFKEAKERLMSDFHARYIKNALSKYGGNVSKAARACGLKRQYFHRLIRHTQINSIADSQTGYATDIFSRPFKEAKERLITDFHARYIKNALSKYGGNVSKAARACGLKRQYFHRLMRHTQINSASYKKGLS